MCFKTSNRQRQTRDATHPCHTVSIPRPTINHQSHQSSISTPSPLQTPTLLVPSPPSVKPFPQFSAASPNVGAINSLFRSCWFQLCVRSRFGRQVSVGEEMIWPWESRRPSGIFTVVEGILGAVVAMLNDEDEAFCSDLVV